MKKILYGIVIIFTLGIGLSSCEKEFLETGPTDAVSASSATLTTDNAWAALNGIHRRLYVRYGSQGRGGMGAFYIHMDELGEDHVFNYATWTTHLRWLHRDETSSYNESNWAMHYELISNANVLINGLDEATGSAEDKKAIIGQSLLYRAFCHYHLVQLYGKRYVPGDSNSQLGIPIMMINTTEPQARATVEEVYAQINTDIDAAIQLLDGYSRKNKSHLNADVAKGLKARVALTQGNYSVAASFAAQVQANYTLMDFDTYKKGFRANSENEDEFIWASQIIEDQTDKWANYGAYISRNFSSSSIRRNPRSISVLLYEMISPTSVHKTLYDPTGEHNDIGVDIVGNAARFPYTNQKFISVSTSDSRVHVPHMRVSEMYLIEAEALARQGSSSAAAALYEMAVVRDPSYVMSTNTGDALIEEILVQRRIELWGEGFRFSDLKRLNLALNRNGSNHKGSIINNVYDIPAGSTMWTSLIPRDEMDANELMVQNDL